MTFAVDLDAGERAFAYTVAAHRQDWNTERGHLHAHKLGDVDYATGLALHEIGALAELAVAKCWELDWRPLWSRLDRSRPDVGCLHVRATARDDGCLLLHKADPPGAPFVLVHVNGAHCRMIGWLRARDGQQWVWWRATARPCYFVPQGRLRPIWTCPAGRMESIA